MTGTSSDPKLLMPLTMGIDDFGLRLISPAKKQPAATAKGVGGEGGEGPGMAAHKKVGGTGVEGGGREPDIHSESKYMVS